jgi:hypothetical protein
VNDTKMDASGTVPWTVVVIGASSKVKSVTTWPRYQPSVSAYNFDVQPVGPAPIFVLFRQGATRGAVAGSFGPSPGPVESSELQAAATTTAASETV